MFAQDEYASNQISTAFLTSSARSVHIMKFRALFDDFRNQSFVIAVFNIGAELGFESLGRYFRYMSVCHSVPGKLNTNVSEIKCLCGGEVYALRIGS